LINNELLNKHLIRGFMELVVFRTNKKYKTEIEVTKEGIKNIKLLTISKASNNR
jgi:hypothetical protein